MSTGTGPLNFDALLTTTDFRREIASLENRIRGFTATNRKEANEIDAIYKKLGGAIGGYFAFTELKSLVTNIVQVRGEFQQLEIAFTTMLKSKVKADALMGQIVDFAAKTPFSVKEVATGAKQLLAYGSAAQNVVDEIKMIGDVSAGVSAPLGDLIYLYGTLRTQGKAFTVDIRQFASRGIPIYEELAKVLKINTSEVSNFVEAGKVGFKEVEQAFRNMTGAGGMFEGLTEKQSQSLTGLISNFSDAVDKMFNDMGKAQEGTLADIIKGATSVVNNYEQVVDILKVLIATYGAYKTAIILTAVAQQSANIGSAISLYLSLAKNIRNAADAMIFLNLVTSLNPYAVVAGAITALVVGYKVLGEETKKVTTAVEFLSEANKDVKTEMSKQKGEITSLINILKNQNIAESVRLEAYEKIKAISPDIIKGLSYEAAKTADLTKELNKYLIALEKKLTLEATSGAFVEAIKQQNEAEEELIKAQKKADELSASNNTRKHTTGWARLAEYRARQQEIEAREKFNEALIETDKVRQKWEKTASMTDKDLIKQRIDNLKQRLNITKNYSPEYKKIEEEIKTLNADLAKSQPKVEETFLSKLEKAESVSSLKLLKNLQKTDSEYETYIKKITETRGKYKQGTKEYNQLNNLLNDLKKQQKQLTSGEGIAPFGSVEYWQNISKKANELLNKINPFAKDKQGDIAKYQAQKLEADIKAEEASRLVSIKSFDDTLEEKKKLYAEFEQWVSLQGKEAASKYYAELLNSGQSYKDFIDREIASLQAKISSGKADIKDRANLLKLKTEDVKIFEEGIEEKKKQYELYNLWLLHAGKEAAEKQFAELRKSGGSIEEFLQNRVLGLKNKIAVGVAVEDTDYSQLVRYETELENINNGFEKYKQRISDAAEELSSLTEKIQFFQAEQAKVSPFDTGKIIFLASQRLEAEKERKRVFKDFQIENNLQELTRLKITKHYGDLRLQAEQEFIDKKSDAYKKAIDKINQMEREELDSLDDRLRLLSEHTQRELNIILNVTNEKQIADFIKSTEVALQKLKESAKGGTGFSDSEVQAYASLSDSIAKAKIALNDLKTEKYSTLLNILGQVGGELSGIKGNLGEIGKALSIVANKGGELLSVVKAANQSKTLNKAAKEAQVFANSQVGKAKELATKAAQEVAAEAAKASKGVSSSLIGIGISLVTDIINNLVAQKKANDELYQSKINFQRDYNALLIEEIRLNTLNKNSFVKDYRGIANDAIEAALKAQAELDKLEVKINNTWGVIYKHHKAWLGWGSYDDLLPIGAAHPDLIKTINGVTKLNVEMAELLVNSGTLTDEAVDLINHAIDFQKTINSSAEQIDDIINDLVGDIGGKLQSALITAFDSGADAAIAFKKVVEEVLLDISRKLLFAAIFQKSLDGLKQDLAKSFGAGGDFSAVDDFQKFLGTAQGLTKVYQDQDKALQDLMKQFGFDTPINAGSTDGLSGGIKSMSQESADVLTGQFNALRITGAQHLEVSKINLDVSRNQLLALTRIANNTDYLKSIDERLKKISDNDNGLRAGGL